MHQLFRLVLGQRDLSRAGDLFALDDAEIEDSLTEALEQIKIISSSSDYQTNNNDQAVVEICITRITTAIRETESIEKHARALVGLWDSCLEHGLRPSGRDEDSPHAKIASDILSCILQNYNRPPVMALAIPVAVKFLHRGSRELCRRMSNYLCLAAITQADLLAEHTEVIVDSILQGNATLLRVLPAVHDKRPQQIDRHLTGLLALMSQLEQAEQYHLLRLLHVAARRRHLEVVRKCVPFLIGHLKDVTHNDIILNILTEISGYEPAALDSFLPRLKETGERFPYRIGQLARIYGAVGHVDEERARSCLLHLVNQLACAKHSFHHVLLLQIRAITEAFPSILGPQSRDVFRMSNSFATIAGLLSRQLDSAKAGSGRRKTSPENGSPEEPGETKLKTPEEGDALQVKIQAFEDKIHSERRAPGSVRRHSLGQASQEDRKDVRLNRSKSLAFHTALTRGVSSDIGEEEPAGLLGSLSLSEIAPLHHACCASPLKTHTVGSQPRSSSASHPSITYLAPEALPEMVKENFQEETPETPNSPTEYEDMLYLHLKENLSKVKAYAAEISRKSPVPDQCTIEERSKTKHFPRPRGHTLDDPQPVFRSASLTSRMIILMKSLISEPLSLRSHSVQFLRALWEKTQAGGARSFETAMTEATFPRQKDLDQVQLHLQEVRFFDVFGFSEAAGAWQCFMCNNPEGANVMNQDGQPLIEGKLKEKQVRWKFIKRKSPQKQHPVPINKKDDPEDAPIELSKVRSVKAVAKKRRDRALPRAFEIFTDNKTYVFKAKDEKNAEEWLQCLSVAVAQAKQRENREVTTYL